ncbi:hypothetical protein [Zavarzinella formosa]|uniref:hypothetical protein n=1 Tax=Zavarzinella formosa TaxID=360055 RepID=UPI0003024E73|nr:hypothetical protein [Zavarzinella formosa]
MEPTFVERLEKQRARSGITKSPPRTGATFVERLGRGPIIRNRDITPTPVPPGTFVTRLRKSPNNIFLVRGNDSTSRKAWYYLQVRPERKMLFEKAVGKGSILLNDFGRVILSGYGENPPDNVRDQMRADYGFEEA